MDRSKSKIQYESNTLLKAVTGKIAICVGVVSAIFYIALRTTTDPLPESDFAGMAAPPELQLVEAPVQEQPVPQLIEASIEVEPAPQLIQASIQEAPAPQLIEASIQEAPAPQLIEASAQEAPAPQLIEAPDLEEPVPLRFVGFFRSTYLTRAHRENGNISPFGGD